MLSGKALGDALERAICLKGVSKAALAREFGIKPPSVTDWVRYGRIDKRHLTHLVDYFSDVVGPEHWGLPASESPSRPADLTSDSGSAGIITLVPHEVILREVPVVGTAELRPEGYWVGDEYPAGHGTEAVVMWPSQDKGAYALRIEGDMLSPRIRHGECIVVEPNSKVVPGDEVLIKTSKGHSMVRVFLYERGGRVYLESINRDAPTISLSHNQIDLLHLVTGIARRSLTR